MNFLKLSFIVFYFSIYFSISVAFSFENTFHIVLDPGHGGHDLGAVRDSFVEAKIVFQITQKIKFQLDQKKNITTTLTRTETQGLSLKERVILANKLKADLFVSLHANTSNSKSMNGMEFYFNSNSPKNISLSSNSAKLKNQALTHAEVIEKIKKDFQFYDKTENSLLLTKAFKSAQEKNVSLKNPKKNRIRRAPFYVIDHTAMPSALIELGFITNRREAKKLTTEEHQNEMAQLITAAILEYKEKTQEMRDKPESLQEE